MKLPDDRPGWALTYGFGLLLSVLVLTGSFYNLANYPPIWWDEGIFSESFIHPFLIMLAVPLALIGVFVAFVVAKYPFDSSAYIGVILMSGIVVKNAILLVDHINLKRRQGLALREAVIQGTKDRIRPILMTTSTTLFGMMPMLLMQAETGVKRQIWSTLALSTVGGLTTSTLFLLVVIPICYFYSDRLKSWIAGKFAEIRGT